MSYSSLVILCVGGWIVAAFALYWGQFNCRLVLKWRAMFWEESARTQEAVDLANEALAMMGPAFSKPTDNIGTFREEGEDAQA